MSAHDEQRIKDGIEEVCRHYLGHPEGEEDGRLLFTCPTCEGLTFALNPVARKAGCRTGRCPPGRHADALDLVMHFDGPLRFPEAFRRGREILGLPRPRDPDAVAFDARSTGGEDGRRPADTGDLSSPVPVPLEVPNTSPGKDGLDEDDAPEEDHREEGWHAVLAEAEGRAASAPQGPPPRVYCPRGAVRLPSSAIVTRGEAFMALIAFPLGLVAARLLLGHAVDSEIVGTLDSARRIVEHRMLAELACGILASLLAWRYLSGRRSAMRLHFGAPKRERREGPGVLRRALIAVEGQARSGITDFKRGARRGRERRRRRRRRER